MINKIKTALKGFTFMMFILYFFVWCPLFILYWFCGMFVFIQGIIADIMNKLDDYIIGLKNER